LYTTLFRHPLKISGSLGFNLLRPIKPLKAVSSAQALQITIEIAIDAALEEVRVNMAELKAVNKPVELVTSVGSCVAICLHDSMNMCGGLAHIMLPDSSIAPQEPLPAKFADTAVPALIEEIKRVGGRTTRLSAKIAGGANMFPTMNALYHRHEKHRSSQSRFGKTKD